MTKIPSPPFLNADYLELTLGWVRSHQRKFSDWIKKEGKAHLTSRFANKDEFYSDLTWLLSETGGWVIYDQALRSFDNIASKRGLGGKIASKIQALGDVPSPKNKDLKEFVSENIESLIAAGHVDLCAEYVWSAFLMWASIPKSAWNEVPIHILSTVQSQGDGLAESLGDYLTYLAGDFDCVAEHIESGNDGDATNMFPAQLPDDQAALTEAWSAARENMLALLNMSSTPMVAMAEKLVELANDFLSLASRIALLQGSEIKNELIEELQTASLQLLDRSDQVAFCRLDVDEFETSLNWSTFDLETFDDTWLGEAYALVLAVNTALDDAVTAFEAKKSATQAYADETVDLDVLTMADQTWKQIKFAFEHALQELEQHRLAEVADPAVDCSSEAITGPYGPPVVDGASAEPNIVGQSGTGLETIELPDVSPIIAAAVAVAAETSIENAKTEIPDEIKAVAIIGGDESFPEPGLGFEEVESAPSDELETFKASVDPDTAFFITSAERKLRTLLRKRRFSLAREFSRAATAARPGLLIVAPTVVFEALSIGDAVRGYSNLSASNAFALLQAPLLEALQKDAETEEAAATQLLGFAAALRPTLFSPQGSASAIVRWGAWNKALYELGQFAGDLSTRLGRPLSAADLAPWRNKQNRVEEANRSTRSLLEWAETAPKQTLKYARGTKIWTTLFKNSPVSRALDLIRQESKDAAKAASAAADWLGESGLLERLDNDHRDVSRDKPLEAGARLRLMAKMDDAAGHLEAWVAAQSESAGTERNQHVANLTGELRRHLETASTRIKSYRSADDNTLAALSVVSGIIDELILAFDGKVVDASLSFEQRLFDEPLMALDVPYKYGQDFAWTAASATQFIGKFEPDALPSFDDTFKELLTQQRYEAAGHVLDRLASEGNRVDEKRVHLSTAFEIGKGELSSKFENLRRQVDVLLGADTSNQIDPSLSNRLDTLVSSMSGSSEPLGAFRDMADLAAEAETVRVEIASAFEILVDPLRTEIAALEAKGEDVSQLANMADRWDLATLSEHLNAAKDGHFPTSATASNGILSQYVTTMLSGGDNPEINLTEFRRALDHDEEWARFDLRNMDKDERSGAKRLIGAWIGLRSQVYDEQTGEQARRAALIELFRELGFTNVKIAQNSSSGAAKTYSIRVDTLDKREYCAVPTFGSECKGNYNVVAVDPKHLPPGEDLFSVLERARLPNSANILMVLGNPSRVRRNQFMHSARRQGTGAATALIDESVIVFLASRAGRRLGDFFDLIIPQGSAHPYNDKATQTSPEMFFGRKQELAQLWNPNGSCLVYGGRQLGKTALLKQLQLQYHKPPHQYVLYNSYDDIGEGKTYPVEELWKRVGESMLAGGVTSSKPSNRKQVEEQLLEFLTKNPLSRVIILVDEADFILKSEIQTEYPNIGPMKARIMEPTNYRCKFVFAGLHNVQRTARSPNSPLLHFGKAIQIGPLYQSDIRAAWEMVERPMSAIGYVFDDPSLIGRILSQVGYYPSFVQSLCTALIERLDRRTARAGVESLPIAITVDDIDGATSDETFNEGLQSKFEKTLELDERYRLITYALLVDGFRDRELGVVTTGHSDVEVQKLALGWWPEGFADDQSLDAFQGLLEEMVGLGVLLRQTGGKYMIRSSRIAAMLGGSEAISQKILELVSKPRPLMLDAGNIRRHSKEDDRVSPLTDRQESMLLSNSNPVHIAVGSTALGLEWLAPNLDRLSEGLEPDEKFQTFRKNYSNSRDLLKCVEAAAADATRGNSRRNLAWVVATGPWPEAETLQRLSEHPSVVAARRGKTNSVRVILVPNAIDWRQDGYAIAEGTVHGAAVLPLATLGESGLHHWLTTMVTGTTGRVGNGDAEELKRLTGGFPRYLWDLKKTMKVSDIMEAARKSYNKRLGDRNVLRELGLDHPDLILAVKGILDLQGVDIDLLVTLGVADPEAAILQLQRLGILESVRANSGSIDLRLNLLVGDLIGSLIHVEA